MSFSRAKVHRFNDVHSDVPSPTRYDPKGDKVKGGLLMKPDRERTTSCQSDTQSTGGTPFRTPFSVVKKHNCLGCEKPAAARPMTFNDLGVAPVLTVTDSEELNFLRSECSDKRETIAQLEKIVENLTVQVTQLEKEKASLVSKVNELEAAKSALESSATNDENNKIEVEDLNNRLLSLEASIKVLEAEKEELLVKKNDAEARIVRLEEGNLEYERRIISLEGTLEQVTIEYKEKEQEVKDVRETSDKLKISIECLNGKISMLEAAKCNNEETIFGLESKLSSLNYAIEAAASGRRGLEEMMEALEKEIDDKQKACQIYEDTIVGLKNELSSLNYTVGEATSGQQNLQNQVENLTEELEEKQKAWKLQEETISRLDMELGCKIEEITNLKTQLKNIKEDNERILEAFETEVGRLTAEKNRIVKEYEEKIFRLHDDYEKKMVVLVQDKEEAFLEKDAVMKLTDLKCSKLLGEMQEKWERKLIDFEKGVNVRQSEQLESMERMREKYESQIVRLETDISLKTKENAAQQERYDEVVNEINALICEVNTKDKNITDLTNTNQTLASNLSTLTDELRKVNAAHSEDIAKLEVMTLKFQEEWRKNEKLSEQLGELDTKVAGIQEELRLKAIEKEKLSADLTKLRDNNNALKVKNLDLQISAEKHQSAVDNLTTELNANRVEYKSQLVTLTEELAEMKRQCRKFEIAMSDTRKSLEALAKRLMESENDVVRLTDENEKLLVRATTAEVEKNELSSNYRVLSDQKIDLEQKLQASEIIEDALRTQVKELELKSCDLELSRNEVLILKETLEGDKEKYEKALKDLQDLVNEANIKSMQMERMCLEQTEAVSQALISKLEEFEKFSATKIQKLNSEISNLKAEKDSLQVRHDLKCEEYDNLFTDHDILKMTYEIAGKEADSLKKHYEEQRIELDNNVAKLNEIALEKKALAEKVKHISDAHDSKCKDLDRLNEIISTLKEEALKQKSNLEALKAECDNKQCELESIKSDLLTTKNACEEKISDMRAQLSQELDKVKNEKKGYQEKLARAIDETAELMVELENGRKTIESFEGAKKELTKTLKQVQESNSSLEDDLKQALEEKKSLMDKVEQLTNEVDEGKERMVELQEIARNDWQVKWEMLLKEKDELCKDVKAITEKKDFYKSHCMRLEKCMTEATAEKDSVEKDFYQINGLLSEKEKEIITLKKRINELERYIEPFREQLEQFALEKSLMEHDRDELRKQHLEQAAKLGHQNMKQKIQHVVKLKSDNLELKKENEKLRIELKSRAKTIEKLREQLGEHPKRLFIGGKRPDVTPFKGKENDAIVGLKQEAMSPSSPLRDRNF